MAEDNSLRDTLKKVAVALKGADVPFAVAGGYGAWARGGPEPGHDVDFFVVEEDVKNAVHALEEAGLKTERPTTEDWLVKVYDGDQVADVIHHPNGRPVTREMIERAEVLPVDSIHMPVLAATDIVLTKLLALDENYLDLGTVLPAARALREQVDWAEVRRGTADSPYADAFLRLAERLGIAPAQRGKRAADREDE